MPTRPGARSSRLPRLAASATTSAAPTRSGRDPLAHGQATTTATSPPPTSLSRPVVSSPWRSAPTWPRKPRRAVGAGEVVEEPEQPEAHRGERGRADRAADGRPVVRPQHDQAVGQRADQHGQDDDEAGGDRDAPVSEVLPLEHRRGEGRPQQRPQPERQADGQHEGDQCAHRPPLPAARAVRSRLAHRSPLRRSGHRSRLAHRSPLPAARAVRSLGLAHEVPSVRSRSQVTQGRTMPNIIAGIATPESLSANPRIPTTSEPSRQARTPGTRRCRRWR